MGDLTVHAPGRRGEAQADDRDGDGGGSEAAESGLEYKNGPRGRRKSLKRLDSDKEIKDNSKENPRIFQAIPSIIQGVSRQIKGFQRMRSPYVTARSRADSDQPVSYPQALK